MSHGSLDHLRSPRSHWLTVVACGILTVVCGWIGQSRYDHEHHPGIAHGIGPAYHALQLILVHGPHLEHSTNAWIDAARVLGVLTFLAIPTLVFGRRLRREWRMLKARDWTGHHIVCGLGAKGSAIVDCSIHHGQVPGVVAIDPSPDSHLAEHAEGLGACLIPSDATHPVALVQAGVSQAAEVVILTPSDEVNVRIATAVRQALATDGNRPADAGPRVFVHVCDIDLREELQRWCTVGTPASGPSPLQFFDVYDNEARKLLLNLPIDGAGIPKGSPLSVHVVILGFGRMGRSIALRAAKMGLFANGKLIRISVVDRNGDRQRQRFLFRHPVLADRELCQLDFHQMEVESLDAARQIQAWAAEPDCLLHIVECLDDDARSLEVAFRLQRILKRHAACNLRVRFHGHHALAELLKQQQVPGPNLFGMVEDTCSHEAYRNDERDRLAQSIHERFVHKRSASPHRNPGNDAALREWLRLPETIRESNRQQADHIEIKLRAIGCRLAEASEPGDPVRAFADHEVDVLAELEHRRWVAERRLGGWEYGAVADKEHLISPHLEEWAYLDGSIQDYDREAVRDIPELVALHKPGNKIVRNPG